MKALRLQIEQQLIGHALEGNFVNLADILQPKHFTKSIAANHQLIWKSFEELFPLSSIDLMTTSVHMRKKHDVQYSAYLSNCMGSVVNNNPHEMALMLLEFNFREAFIELLNSELALNPDKNEVVLEMLEVANDYSNDIIEIMDDITGFSLKENLQLYESFNELNIRANHIGTTIKELAHVRALITHLKQLKGLTLKSHSLLAIRELTELLLLTLSSKSIPADFNQTLKKIKNDYFQ
jgi:hypothetical protein